LLGDHGGFGHVKELRIADPFETLVA